MSPHVHGLVRQYKMVMPNIEVFDNTPKLNFRDRSFRGRFLYATDKCHNYFRINFDCIYCNTHGE